MAKRTEVRLIDIAQRLGLSKVSVSKALRDHPDISTETRSLVKATAKEMGYVPNLVARSLSSSRSRTLGVIVPKIAHSFFAEAIDGIIEGASDNDYEIVLTVSQENPEIEQQHIETLLSMRVDGLLVSVTQGQANLKTYERIRKMGIPLVFFDRMIEGLGFSGVVVDDEGGAFRAIDHVVGLGYRKIAHLAGYSHVNIGKRRRAGYERALRKHGLPVHEPWIIEGGFSELYGYKGFRALYEQGDLPEAIFGVTFPVAFGIGDAMREIDPSLIDDTQIIAFGPGDVNRFLRRPFICIHQPARELGYRAISRLLHEMEEPKAAGAVEVLQTYIVTPEDSLRLTYTGNDPTLLPSALAPEADGKGPVRATA